MILVSKTYWAGTPFHFRTPPAGARVESLVLRAADAREVRAIHWTPEGQPRPRVGVVAIHPRVDFTHHYTFPRLVAAGIACLGAMARSANNDSDVEHEALVLDVAACVSFLREERGVEKVILLGNSGGGSLSAFFQAQARLPPDARIERSPAGGRTMLRLAKLVPADAMIYVAAHRGQGAVLGECIDPAVVDESDPLATDPDLDMYDTRNGFRPPPVWSEYPDDFVARFRAAQRARVARLDAIARTWIQEGRAAAEARKGAGFAALPFEEQQRVERRAAFEPVMVIYRTMANLNYTDRRLDPSEREYGSLLSDRPDLMNMALLGFGRVCTPRAWLSTWSALSTNADLIRNLRGITEPTLVVHAGRDREIYPRTDARPIFEAVASADRTFVEMPDARHYFEPDFGEREAPQVERLMDRVLPWILERFEVAPRAAATAVKPPPPARHPTTRDWQFPPVERGDKTSAESGLPAGIERTNLRDLIARPGRFEHHLMVVASLGVAQLEAVTASEPLFFAHRNISDEYALAMRTGDPAVDGFPLRTFLMDMATGEDVGRLNHRVGDVVLHPHGYLHWPGRLRPPYAPFVFPPGMRKTGLSLVYCASRPCPPDGRPLFVSAGRDADAKAYGSSAVPFLIADTAREGARRIGAIGDTALDLLVSPSRVAPPRGGYLVVLDAAPGSLHFPADLLRIPPGGEVPVAGLSRALLLSSPSAEPEPAPASWSVVPEPPFPPFESAPRGALPISTHGLTIEAASPTEARISLEGGATTTVPRYWLARMLFREALHGVRLGYLETYGGFYTDDGAGGDLRLGIRGKGAVTIPAAEAMSVIEKLYHAAAPDGYTEHLE
jgi:alpha-beta hydrolase superfamily lysophospholipase